MEGTPRPSRYTSWIFSFEWPLSRAMSDDLVRACKADLMNWVVIPVTAISPEALQSEAEALSMRVQDSYEP